ncbi:MAG: ketopantoate reductase family protein [Dokdonella sp.]
MRVLVLGAGATGGYFGARLIEAGVDVDFLVRPARAKSLSKAGLRIHGTRDEVRLDVNPIVTLPESYACDLVLLSCKSYDLDSAIISVAPAMATGARLLPLLNGLRHLDVLDHAFGADSVLGGLCHISVALQADGSIRQVGSVDRLTFGSRPGQPMIPESILQGMRSMKAESTVSKNVIAAMWNKFTLLTTLAGATCLMRASIGEIVAVAQGTDLIRSLYRECTSVAQHSGFAPTDDDAAEALRILTAENSPLKASMLRDVERAHRTEVEHVLGDMLARAKSFDLATPLLAAACTHLRIHEAALLR